MSGGTVNISRSLWDDTAFAAEPFSEREAWIWLIAEASWKPREKRIGSAIVSTKRGQAAMSIRFMADAWGWSKSRVHRYLGRLKNRDMIVTDSGTGVMLVTICKYDEYQWQQKSSGTPAGHQRDTSGTNDKKGEIKVIKEDTNVSLSVSTDAAIPANDVSQAVKRYNDAAAKAGWPQVQRMNANRSKQLKARLRESDGVGGWEVALRKAFDSDFCRGRTSRPWTGFGFDWLIKATNYTKLMEGNYDNRTNNGPCPSGAGGSGSDMVDAFAEVGRRRSGG